MKVIMTLGKVRHTFMVRDRRQALDEIKVNLFPLRKKGDSLVWTKSSEKSEFVDQVTIVDNQGNITKNSAQIITGGTKVAKAKKVTPAEKTTPATKEVKVTKEKAQKKQTPSQVVATVQTLQKLPKSGRTIQELASTVYSISGGTERNVERVTKKYCDFLVLMGILKVEGGRFKLIK